MGLFNRLFGDGLDGLISNGTDDELEEEYERRRVEWLKNDQNGTGVKTPEMQRLDTEISRRSAENWMNDPRRNTDPNFRWTDANRWDRD